MKYLLICKVERPSDNAFEPFTRTATLSRTFHCGGLNIEQQFALNRFIDIIGK